MDIKGVDLGHGPVSLGMTKDAVVVNQPELDDRNAATFDVDVTAYGSSTYVGVEAEVLAVQDQMSSAIATALISSDGF